VNDPGSAEVIVRSSSHPLMMPKYPIAAAVVLGLAFALALPAYSGPDEVGHVAYVAALAHGHLPVIPVGAVADISTGTTWQGQHPPLFYLLAVPFYLAAGKNPTVGIYLMRLLGVASLAFTVSLIYRIAAVLLPQSRDAAVAAWIVALHPTVVYVCSMANNEALATALAIACVWAAVNGTMAGGIDPRKRRHWLVLAALFGGLGLLAKLTAIAGVAAAAYIAGQKREGRSNALQGFAVLFGAMALWLPWGLLMYRLHGEFVPSPIHRPVLSDGLWAFVLIPGPVSIVLAVATAQYAIGLLLPYWLMAPYPFTYFPMLGLAWALSIGVILVGVFQPRWRFVVISFVVLAGLVESQVLFRDGEAILFLARYTPPVCSLAAIMVAGLSGRLPRRPRGGLAVLWGAVVIATVAYIFYFFLIAPPISSRWK
jgi:hypothetical protein